MTPPASQPWQWGAVEAATAVRDGAVTPLDLLESVLARIDAVEQSVRAFTHVDRDGANRQAEQLTRDAREGTFRGPLHGVPIAIKDIFDVAGLATRCGSALFTNAGPATADAAVVARLRSAGAVVVGKTATHELACGVYTEPARNPWDLSLCCGGSSGGSGAAVAAGEAMAATGSDTGGSIRIPAAVCGIVGIKPTYDLVSRSGVAALSWTLDHIGPLARSVDDAALVLRVMIGPGRGNSESVWPIPAINLGTTTFGVPDDPVLARAQPSVSSAFDDTCGLLEDAGSKLVNVSVPELAETLAIEFAIVMAEAASYYDRELRDRSSLISEGIRVLFQSGAVLPSEDYLKAQRLRSVLCRALDRAFAEHGLDAMCTPTVPMPAYAPTDTHVTIAGREEPIIDAVVRTTAPFNLSGLPVVAMPMGLTEEGLPVSVQFVGRAYQEPALLAIAAEYERLREPLTVNDNRPINRQSLR
jgi:aspartyl-tRNA(Asn)/glutamyl-tRNA(Gln) amidotransferase subunit A